MLSIISVEKYPLCRKPEQGSGSGSEQISLTIVLRRRLIARKEPWEHRNAKKVPESERGGGEGIRKTREMLKLAGNVTGAHREIAQCADLCFVRRRRNRSRNRLLGVVIITARNALEHEYLKDIGKGVRPCSL